MSGGEEMGSQPLSEELEFLTACLLGHEVHIQGKSQLLSGILEGASFDNDYGVMLDINGNANVRRSVKTVLKDIVYIFAQNVSLQIDQDSMLKISTFFPRISHVEDTNAPGPSNFADQSLRNSEPIRPSMRPTQGGEERIPDVELMPELTYAASFIPYIVLYDNRVRPFAVLQEPGPEGTRFYRLRPGEEHPRCYRLPPPPDFFMRAPIQAYGYIAPIHFLPMHPTFPQGQPHQHHGATGPPHSRQFDGRGHRGS